MKIVVLAGGLSTERNVSRVTGTGVCRALREKGHQAIFVDMFLGLEDYEGSLENIFGAPDGLCSDIRVESAAPDLDAVRRSRAGLQDPKRPIGSFIFLGTTGVGKTELAKALAEFLFDDENMMTRIDMSEYQEKFSVTRLIGSPPGYVGYDEGGQLTEAIRRKPYSVVLFDEIEKAHPDVFNTLLQVLDDGRLTDNKGRVVNFKNTIIIMTSNLGSDHIREKFEGLTAENRDVVVEDAKETVLAMLKQTIRPEFLNRIDEIIMFTPLSKAETRRIVDLQIDSIYKMLKNSGVELRVTEDARDFIAEEGYDPQFGARPIKRVIQRYLLNDLSKSLLAQTVDKEKPIVVDKKDGSLVFSN
jgi:ATP-dependent Clp protease ATP-binding subunit ClpB